MIYYKVLDIWSPFKFSLQVNPTIVKLVGPFGYVLFCAAFQIFFSGRRLWLCAKKNLITTFLTLFFNKLRGLQQLFKVRLVLKGLGFKCNLRQKFLIFRLGFTHVLIQPIPQYIKVKVLKKFTRITFFGCDLQKMREFSQLIRLLRPPEPYKGKGIRYVAEYIKLKVIKKS